MRNHVKKSRKEYERLYQKVRHKFHNKLDTNLVEKRAITEIIRIDNKYVPLQILMGGYAGYGDYSPRIWLRAKNGREFEICPQGYGEDGKHRYQARYLEGLKNSATEKEVLDFLEKLKNKPEALDFMYRTKPECRIFNHIIKYHPPEERETMKRKFIEELVNDIDNHPYKKIKNISYGFKLDEIKKLDELKRGCWSESWPRVAEQLALILQLDAIRKGMVSNDFEICGKIQTLLHDPKMSNSLQVINALSNDFKSDTIKKGRCLASLDDRICYVLSSEASKDNKIIEHLFSMSDFNRGENQIIKYLFTDTGATECHRVEGTGRNYFIKRIDLTKVPFNDYELYVAEILEKKGLDVKKPRGIAIVNTLPYIVFDYAEDSTDLQSTYYVKDENKRKKFIGFLEKNKEKIFSNLGEYVRKMFSAGVYDKDMAKRNFMARFDDEGKFRGIHLVDFEKTVIKENLSEKEIDASLEMLTKYLTEEEKRAFFKGYKQEKS